MLWWNFIENSKTYPLRCGNYRIKMLHSEGGVKEVVPPGVLIDGRMKKVPRAIGRAAERTDV
jgi:hypothetical protein